MAMGQEVAQPSVQVLVVHEKLALCQVYDGVLLPAAAEAPPSLPPPTAA